MRVTWIGLYLLMVLQAPAQNLPTAPAPGNATSSSSSPLPGQHVSVYAQASPARARVFDRKFLLLAGMASAATVLDAVSASHCMSKYASCQEGNPLLGSHPSTAKLYGVSLSLLAGQVAASAWMRHAMPNRKLWMIPPVLGTAVHGLAAALNLRTMHQLSQP